MRLKTRITNQKLASGTGLLVAICRSELIDGKMVAMTVTHGSDEITFRRQPGEHEGAFSARAHDGAGRKWNASSVVLLPEDAMRL